MLHGTGRSRRLCLETLIVSLVVMLACAVAPAGILAGQAAAVTVTRRVVVLFGEDLAPSVRERLAELLASSTAGQKLDIRGAVPVRSIPAGSLVLSFGDTSVTRALIPRAELAEQGSEGFVVRSGSFKGRPAIAAAGNAPSPDRYALGLNTGLSYASYALLEELGFAFLHPLQPMIPGRISYNGRAIDIVEKPYWPDRGIHLHTMHPLELTDLLNGWGKTGPEDEAGWRSMLPEWRLFLEWSAANRLNSVEWFPLAAESWRQFAESPTRQARFAELVGMAHGWGMGVGADAPFALQQQHSWYMVAQQGSLPDELAQIRSRIDWMMGAGFDFLGSEMGSSEFIQTDDTRMIAWMNEAARYLDESYGGRRLYIKIHCSTGQKSQNYTDPETGEPLNYNFLAHYADPRVGIMPHTVQPYALDDPAPTYENTDFAYMREFMQEEAGAREVRWHPETAYWCTYDIDMPLFIPLYAERRLHDLRLIAADEAEGRMGRSEHSGARIQGQMFFSSGWEWGYWLNDVVTARASWNPFAEEPDEGLALKKALRPVVRPFGGKAGAVSDLLTRLIDSQYELLVLGKVDGSVPADIRKRNGQAYLEGWDSEDDFGDLLGLIPFVDPIHAQADKLQLVGLYDLFEFETPQYAEVEPLLAEMAITFTALADEFDALRPGIPARAMAFFDEMRDGARVTALRAVQVHGLYDYVFKWGEPAEWRRARLQVARDALDSAAAVSLGREASYRVEPERIAGWRYNPTAYPFGYLWSVRTLWYWWRDEGKAVDQPLRPGYMNHVNTIDLLFGEGSLLDFSKQLRKLGDLMWVGLFEIAAAPETEPTVPPYNLRSRP